MISFNVGKGITPLKFDEVALRGRLRGHMRLQGFGTPGFNAARSLRPCKQGLRLSDHVSRELISGTKQWPTSTALCRPLFKLGAIPQHLIHSQFADISLVVISGRARLVLSNVSFAGRMLEYFLRQVSEPSLAWLLPSVKYAFKVRAACRQLQGAFCR